MLSYINTLSARYKFLRPGHRSIPGPLSSPFVNGVTISIDASAKNNAAYTLSMVNQRISVICGSNTANKTLATVELINAVMIAFGVGTGILSRIQ